MTDKEIIINGIDVSECNYAILPNKQCYMKSMFYAKETSCIACKEHNTKRNFCKNNPNCYYKQLKRKERECEELKREIAFGNNGKLSDKIRAIVFKNLNAENSKYKQALDEIEKQVKAMNNECFYDDICDCNNCDMKNGCSYYRKFNHFMSRQSR
jgi:hypothetical protein